MRLTLEVKVKGLMSQVKGQGHQLKSDFRSYFTVLQAMEQRQGSGQVDPGGHRSRVNVIDQRLRSPGQKCLTSYVAEVGVTHVKVRSTLEVKVIIGTTRDTLPPTADIYQLNQQIYLMILAGGLTSTSSCIFSIILWSPIPTSISNISQYRALKSFFHHHSNHCHGSLTRVFFLLSGTKSPPSCKISMRSDRKHQRQDYVTEKLCHRFTILLLQT